MKLSKETVERNKNKPRYCKCAYQIETDKIYKICEKCGAKQKHGRWK